MGIILANSGGKYDCVNAVHFGNEGTDILFNVLNKDINGKLCSFVAGVARAVGNSLFKVASVGRETGNAEETALFIHEVAHFVGSKALFVHDICNNGGVDIAATGTHFNAGKRSKAHCCVDNLSVLNGGDRRAVAEVAGNNLGSFNLTEDIGHNARNITVRGSVEAVTANFILFVHFVRDSVHKGFSGHSLVEGGVENNNLGSVLTKTFDACADTLNMGFIMKRGKLGKIINIFNYLFVN